MRLKVIQICHACTENSFLMGATGVKKCIFATRKIYINLNHNREQIQLFLIVTREKAKYTFKAILQRVSL
jgi:hypothetical protein